MADPVGAVILCGGKSSRMGRDKAELPLFGEETFLERLLSRLRACPEVLLAAGEPRYARYGVPVVKDAFPGCGPIAGLRAALTACRSEALVCVPCDVPDFPFDAVFALWEEMDEGIDAVVLETGDGRLHPLCGMYRKGAAACLERCLKEGNYRMRAALEAMRVRVVPLTRLGVSDEALQNVNTPEDYARYLQKGEPMNLRFLYDPATCIGCASCQMACKDRHHLPVGAFFRRAGMREYFAGGEMRRVPFSLSCNHCQNPACAAVCPTGAMKKEEDGAVLHDDSICIGCGRCVWACPYGEISLSQKTGLAQKCDTCIDLRQQGMTPACVAACPTESLRFALLPDDAGAELRRPFLPDPAVTRPATRLKEENG